MYRRYRYRAVVTQLAVVLRWSEFKVRARVREGRMLRNDMPRVWEAFSIGDIDAQQASLIGAVACTFEDPASVARLERRAVRYAPRHTTGELRRWLKLVVREIEPVASNDAYYAHHDRTIRVVHDKGNGMSWINAYVPTYAAVAIQSRLLKVAETLQDDPETGPRSLEQRCTDLFMSWLTNNDNLTPGQYHVDVAVKVKGTVVQAVDGTWSLPAPIFQELIWKSRVREWDITESIESTSRFATGRLRTTIEYRDGHCQVPGCSRTARGCDIDHRTAWPDGTILGGPAPPPVTDDILALAPDPTIDIKVAEDYARAGTFD